MRHIKLFENFSINEGVSQSEIQKVIDYYKKPGLMPLWHEMARNDFYSMATGQGDPDLLRRYPSWTEEDFKKVIIALDGKYEESESESEGMEQETPEDRPTQQEINQVANKFKTVNSRAWNTMARNDFYSMAEGNGDPSVIDNYYPGWTEEDFQTVIKLVDGEYEP